MSKTKAVINLDDKADKESELGTLIVILLKARNLNDKHSFRKSDVFAQATLNGAQKRTHVDIKGGQRPEWDGEIRFGVMKNTGAKFRKLEVACYSQEPRSEDLMGQGVVDITETLRTGEFDDWVPLSVDGVQRGEIYLEMTYYANAPPPTNVAPAHNKQLSALLAPNQGNLGRRPSKLSPSERLSRPQAIPSGQGLSPAQAYAQSHSSQASKFSSSAPSQPSRLHEQYSSQTNLSRPGPNQNQAQNGLPTSMRPAHSSSAGSSPSGRHDSLPGIQDPYGAYPGPRPGGQAATTQQQQPPQGASLPNILRSGPGGSPPSTSPRPPGHGHVRQPSAPLPAAGIYPGYGQDQLPSSTNPYIGGSGSASPPNIYIGGRASSPQPPAHSQPPPNPNVYIHGQGNANLSANSGLEPTRAYSPIPPTGPATIPGPLPNSIPVQGVPFISYGSPPGGTPLLWKQNTHVPPPSSNGSGFLFPAPNIVSSPTQERPRHQSFSGYNDPNALVYNNDGRYAAQTQHIPPNVGYGQQQPSHYQQRPSLPGKSLSQDERPFDPYLQARYQTPLPLPPGASSSSSSAPAASASAPTRPAPSLPNPGPTKTLPNVPPPQPVGTPGPDRARLEVLKRAEEEASRRREQELKDLELALQLDRELNLAEERSNLATGRGGGSGPMPGGWR